MQQYGLYLQSVEPRLKLAETEDELLTGAAVWLPWRLAGFCPEIWASWDITSDSLALWLAQRLAAAQLLLVKSTRLSKLRCTAEKLAADGVVDAAFPQLLRSFAGHVDVAAQDGVSCLVAYLGRHDHPFTHVEVDAPR
jgi:aspartokinase-like uncharacterized kinase